MRTSSTSVAHLPKKFVHSSQFFSRNCSKNVFLKPKKLMMSIIFLDNCILKILYKLITTFICFLYKTVRRNNHSMNTHLLRRDSITHSCYSSQISLYSLIWDFLLSQINMWTTTTWCNVWVVLPKPSWYEFLIGFLIWIPASKYLHLTTFSNICVI